MATPDQAVSLEAQIDEWRSFLRRRQAIHAVDVTELEDHLREQVAVLTDAGLATDEAFLVAVKRMGALDEISREFAREHSDRLWKQLVVAPSEPGGRQAVVSTDAVVVFALAVAAAALVKVPALFGLDLDDDAEFYGRNASLFVLPLLTGYFAWKRRLDRRTVLWLAAAFAAAAVFANIYTFATQVLTALHVPIALWLVVGIAYAGARWKEVAGRMDFVRFSGELFIYYVLMALGGGLLTAFTVVMFNTIGINPETFIQSWLLPCGAAGAVLVAAWLVEAKQSVIENMAPVLTRLFTPLFAAVLVTFLGALLVTGHGVDIERDALIDFNLILVVVLALLLYSVSARDPRSSPGLFDGMQVVLVVSALITDLGFSANRVAALGVNAILLINLAWSAVLYVRFLRGRGSIGRVERWQTDYLPVYAAWSALVVIAFPPLFGYA